jgi:hypothetical protein
VVARRNEYTDTVRDLKSLIRREAEEDKRRELSENVDRMVTLIERQREKLTDLAVLTERVDGLTWMVRGVIVSTAVQIVAGIVIALLLKGR